MKKIDLAIIIACFGIGYIISTKRREIKDFFYFLNIKRIMHKSRQPITMKEIRKIFNRKEMYDEGY